MFVLISCQSEGGRERSALIEGQRMYHSLGCAACHGIKGDGLGDRSIRLNPSPRDFRDKGAYRQGNTITEIAQTIANGITGSPVMPQYSYLKREERINIAKYVYFLQTNRQTTNKSRRGINPR